MVSSRKLSISQAVYKNTYSALRHVERRYTAHSAIGLAYDVLNIPYDLRDREAFAMLTACQSYLARFENRNQWLNLDRQAQFNGKVVFRLSSVDAAKWVMVHHGIPF